MDQILSLHIPKEYPIVICMGLAINIHAVSQADSVARMRSKIFPT